MKNKNFHRAIQSNNEVFAGFSHVTFCHSGGRAQLFWLEMTLFSKYITQNRKTFITQPKHMLKSFCKLMIRFCYFCKKNCFFFFFFFLFLQFFFRNAGFQLKSLILIESSNIFLWKPKWAWSWGKI